MRGDFTSVRADGLVGFINDKQVPKHPIRLDMSRCNDEVTRQARFHERVLSGKRQEQPATTKR
jgi:hypothetical protein